MMRLEVLTLERTGLDSILPKTLRFFAKTVLKEPEEMILFSLK